MELFQVGRCSIAREPVGTHVVFDALQVAKIQVLTNATMAEKRMEESGFERRIFRVSIN